MSDFKFNCPHRKQRIEDPDEMGCQLVVVNEESNGKCRMRREAVKCLVAMITMVVLAMSVGCSRSLEKEAGKRAREHWKLTTLGGSNYLCETTAATKPSQIGSERASKTVYELRNIKVEVSPHSLSEADKLNGVEWRGSVHVGAEAFRRYSPQPYNGGNPDQTWSAWKSPPETMFTRRGDYYVDTLYVRKTKSEWEVGESLREMGQSLQLVRRLPVTFKQVEASDLPK